MTEQEQPKWVGKSLTILGTLLAVAPQIVSAVATLNGWDIEFTEADAQQIYNSAETLITSAGVVLAAFGIRRAQKQSPVYLVKKPKG